MDKIIYGNEVAREIRSELKKKIEDLKRAPHLVVILVGNNPASETYVGGKEKACAQVGMKSSVVRMDDSISEETLIQKIDELNSDRSVDGILVQLPLPKHINELNVLERIDINKDVDGFHPMNVGKLSIGEDAIVSCTPLGIMRLLESVGMDDLSAKHVVVMGRSNIVGKPMVQLLLKKNATLSIVHSKTENIKEITKQADILIVAVGQERLVDETYIKDGVTIIDVGIHRTENGLCGDVNFDRVIDKVEHITPVPKGVGPMTIAMLLENTLECYRRNS